MIPSAFGCTQQEAAFDLTLEPTEIPCDTNPVDTRQDEGVLEAMRRDLEEASGQRDALVAELRAYRAAEDTHNSLGAAVDVLVGDAMAGAREAALEREVEGLRIDLEAALADAVELAKNPAWETEVPADEWEAMLEEKEACLEGLLEERAAMEEHIASVEGEKVALERRVGALEGEKKAVQGQMNMLMISSSDSENRLHELEAELCQLRRDKKRLEKQLSAQGGSSAAADLADNPEATGGDLTVDEEEMMRLEEEVSRLEEERQVLLQQMMVQTQDKGRLEAELKSLRGKYDEMEILMHEMEMAADEAAGAGVNGSPHSPGSMDLNGAAFGGTDGGNMVSMAVLEDFQEQQMEERAEWESERTRMQAELRELKSRLPGVSLSPGGKENEAEADWQLVQV